MVEDERAGGVADDNTDDCDNAHDVEGVVSLHGRCVKLEYNR